MRVLLTGASGFLGRALRERLAGRSDVELACLSRGPDETRAGRSAAETHIAADLLRLSDDAKARIASFSPDVCVHLAWQGIPDFSEERCTANRLASEGLLAFLQEKTPCRRALLAGSCWEYGSQDGPCAESDKVAPKGELAKAKADLLRWCEARSAADPRFHWTWFRIFFAYGPGQRAGSLIPSLYRTIKAGQPFDVRSPGAVNDFIYVDDVARGFELALDAQDGAGVVNLGSGRAVPNIEICRIMETSLTGSDGRTRELESLSASAAGGPGFWADITKARVKLGWKPSVSLEDGIRLTIKTMEHR